MLRSADSRADRRAGARAAMPPVTGETLIEDAEAGRAA